MASWHTEEVSVFVCTLAVGLQPYGWTIRVVRIERFKYGSVRTKGEVAVTRGSQDLGLDLSIDFTKGATKRE
jgi:hypothetical protein